MVEEIVKFGERNTMIWCCINWESIGFASRNEGKMNEELHEEILKDELMNSLDCYGHNVKILSFSKTMTSSTPAKEFKSGLIPRDWDFTVASSVPRP